MDPANVAINLESAIEAVARMAQIRGLEFSYEALQTEEQEEFIRFLSHDAGPDVFLLPQSMINLLVRHPSSSQNWAAYHLLSDMEKRVLFFSAEGYDPSLIIESVADLDQQSYWSVLNSAREKWTQVCGRLPEKEDLIHMKQDLAETIDEWIEQTELSDAEVDRKKGVRFPVYLGLFSLLVLLPLLVFLWPLFSHPDLIAFYEQKIPPVLDQLAAADPAAGMETVCFELLMDEQFEECYRMIQSSRQSGEEINAETEAAHILVSIRLGRLSEARSSLALFKSNYPELYRNYFKGSLWQIRLLK